MAQKRNESGSNVAGSGVTDESLIRTLMTRGPRAFKQEYEEGLYDKYVRPDTETGEERSPLSVAYATAQNVAADVLIPDSAEEAALGMMPIGSVGRVGRKAGSAVRALRKEAKPLAQGMSRSVEKAVEETAEQTGRGAGELVDDVSDLGGRGKPSDSVADAIPQRTLDYSDIRRQEIAKKRAEKFTVAGGQDKHRYLRKQYDREGR